MENKRWSFSKKIHGNILYSLNVLKRRSLQKQRTGIWSFFYHQERWDFFLPDICNFFYGRKIKNDLPQKIYGNMMFSVCSVKLIFLFPTNIKWPFCQKRKDDLFPKNTPKTDISSITEKGDIRSRKEDFSSLEWHSRKISDDSLYIYGDRFRCFNIYFFPMKKNPENLIYRIEIWLYL